MPCSHLLLHKNIYSIFIHNKIAVGTIPGRIFCVICISMKNSHSYFTNKIAIHHTILAVLKLFADKYTRYRYWLYIISLDKYTAMTYMTYRVEQQCSRGFSFVPFICIGAKIFNQLYNLSVALWYKCITYPVNLAGYMLNNTYIRYNRESHDRFVRKNIMKRS